jgi:hypothetical protein
MCVHRKCACMHVSTHLFLCKTAQELAQCEGPHSLLHLEFLALPCLGATNTIAACAGVSAHFSAYSLEQRDSACGSAPLPTGTCGHLPCCCCKGTAQQCRAAAARGRSHPRYCSPAPYGATACSSPPVPCPPGGTAAAAEAAGGCSTGEQESDGQHSSTQPELLATPAKPCGGGQQAHARKHCDRWEMAVMGS